MIEGRVTSGESIQGFATHGHASKQSHKKTASLLGSGFKYRLSIF
jgi:hypothetical protein